MDERDELVEGNVWLYTWNNMENKGGRMPRRGFLKRAGILVAGASVFAGVVGEKLIESGLEFAGKDGEGKIVKGTKVSWDSPGVQGPGDDSRNKMRGSYGGEGVATDLRRVINWTKSGKERNSWVRVKQTGVVSFVDEAGRKRTKKADEVAWHEADTLVVIEEKE